MQKEELQKMTKDSKVRHWLCAGDCLGVARKGSRRVLVVDLTLLVVPRATRKQVFEALHKVHLWRDHTYWCACSRYFWLGMREAIHKMVDSCKACLEWPGPWNPDEEMVDTVQRNLVDHISWDNLNLNGNEHLLPVNN